MRRHLGPSSLPNPLVTAQVRGLPSVTVQGLPLIASAMAVERPITGLHSVTSGSVRTVLRVSDTAMSAITLREAGLSGPTARVRAPHHFWSAIGKYAACSTMEGVRRGLVRVVELTVARSVWCVFPMFATTLSATLIVRSTRIATRVGVALGLRVAAETPFCPQISTGSLCP